MLIVTCEIDQFACVIGIGYDHINCRITITKYLTRCINCEYLPKEIFNMINIEFIDLMSFSYSYLYYAALSIPKNHYLCKWNNLVNLKAVYSARSSFFERCQNDGHVRIINYTTRSI